MSTRLHAQPLSSRFRHAAKALAQLPARLAALQSVARTRKSLGRMDDHLLRDIGLTRHEAHIEAKRPIWDAPLHWRR